MAKHRPLVAIGLLGPTLDAGRDQKRWNRWRPSIGLHMQDDLAISRFEMLHQRKYDNLAAGIAADITQVSPTTTVKSRHIEFSDPWDFEDVYGARRILADGVLPADIVLGNEEEVAASGVTDVPTLVLKRGERGATVYDRGEETDVPSFPVEVVNGLGAGDAFAAALGHGLLNGLSLAEAARRGNVAGALVASRLACSEAMPRLVEIEGALV